MRAAIVCLVIVTWLTGCAGPAAAPGPGSADHRPAASAQVKRLTVAIGAELNNLATKLESANTYAAEYNFMTNSPLALIDERGAARPFLASELPSRDRGTWVVNADGTMATTWRIRTNARWHDGQPVNPRDFIFALRVYTDDAVAVGDRTPERFMDRIESIDAHTFVIRWKQPSPWANELGSRQLDPLPAHLMQEAYEAGDADAFVNHAFWSSTAYVGNGPYRLVQWDPGAQLVFRAFDDFFLGKPKIDEVIFRVFPDANAALANLLSGTVDVSVGSTLPARLGHTLQVQWAATGAGQVVSTPTNFRHLRFQFDPARTQQPALLDRGVRQAVYQALDRQLLAEVGSEGTSPVADLPLSPSDPVYPRAMQEITRFPYDVSRAQALLDGAGWLKRGDTLVGPSGQPFTVELSTAPGSELEMPAVAAQLGQLGMQVTQFIIPQARMRDNEFRASFPGITFASLPVGPPRGLDLAVSDQCPTAERRFAGVNRSCWKNAEYDRWANVAVTSLEAAERENAWIQALKILTDDVGVVGLSYNMQVLAARTGITGPGQRWPGQSGSTWNIHEWEAG
jgi:peptide/nickel transport system substrate-binding protein